MRGTVAAENIDIFPSNDNPERNYQVAELVRFYLEAERRLPSETRAAQFLFVEGFEAWAIAEALGISQKAVESRLARARESIIEYIKGKVDGHGNGDGAGGGPIHQGDRVGRI